MISKTKFKGLIIIKNKPFKDKRGYFKELFREKEINKKFPFIVMSLSKKNVIRGLHLQKKSTKFRAIINESGINTINSESQIIPIVIGDNQATLDIARKLSEEGIIVGAIRPPPVPEGSARLRISISLAHTDEDLMYAAEKNISLSVIGELVKYGADPDIKDHNDWTALIHTIR